MAKLPVTVFADPDVETALTIKPFAAAIAVKPGKHPRPLEAITETETFTSGSSGNSTDLDTDLYITSIT